MLRFGVVASFGLSLSWLLEPVGVARADEPSSATAPPADDVPRAGGDAAPVPGDDAPGPEAAPRAERIDAPLDAEAALVAARADEPSSAAPAAAPRAPDEAALASDGVPYRAVPFATRGRARITPLPGYAPPPGYVLGTANRRGVWAGGIGVSGGAWLLSTGMAALVASATGDRSLLAHGCLPILGSFLLAADDVSPATTGMGVALGLTQLAGVGMILGGSIARREVWLREDLARPNVVVGAGPTGGSLRVSF